MAPKGGVLVRQDPAGVGTTRVETVARTCNDKLKLIAIIIAPGRSSDAGRQGGNRGYCGIG